MGSRLTITGVAGSVIAAGSLLLLSTPSTAADPGRDLPPLSETCLPTVSESEQEFGLHLGFPRSPYRPPTTGRLDVAVIYVDFPDAPAEEPIAEMHARTIPDGLVHLEKLSHGRIDAYATRSPNWVRMPKPITAYLDNPGIRFDGRAHHQFIVDAVAAADPVMDFTHVDIVGVVIEKNLPRPPLGIAFIGGEGSTFSADGRTMTDAFTLMHPLFLVDTVVAHELLHNLGLVDLYDGRPDVPAETGAVDQFVGGYSTMGNSRGHSPELFSWEQWVLGWIPDDDVACVQGGAREIRIAAASTSKGTRLATVPLGGNRFVAFEVRAAHGLDRPPRPGVLPYVVSPDTPTSYGPIRVPRAKGYEVIPPLRVGEQYILEGVGVEVLSGRGTQYSIRVHPTAPAAEAPGAVRNLRVSSTPRLATISWAAPLATGWTTITGYQYRVGLGPWIATTSTNANVTPPKRGGVIEVQVRAVNIAGEGPPTKGLLRAR